MTALVETKFLAGINLTPHLFLVSYRWPSLIWKYPAIHCNNGAHVITFLLRSWPPWVLWLDARPKVKSARASKLQMMEMKLMLTWHGHGHWVSQDWENQSWLSFLKQRINAMIFNRNCQSVQLHVKIRGPLKTNFQLKLGVCFCFQKWSRLNLPW